MLEPCDGIPVRGPTPEEQREIDLERARRNRESGATMREVLAPLKKAFHLTERY